MKLPYFSILEPQASTDFPFEAFHSKKYFLQIEKKYNIEQEKEFDQNAC